MTDENKIEIFREKVIKQFSNEDGSKFKKISWEIFDEALDGREFSIILVLLEERKVFMERIQISAIKRMLKKSDEELRCELSLLILSKDKQLKSIRELIEECKSLEKNNLS